jgi:hypothetical protein
MVRALALLVVVLVSASGIAADAPPAAAFPARLNALEADFEVVYWKVEISPKGERKTYGPYPDLHFPTRREAQDRVDYLNTQGGTSKGFRWYYVAKIR